MLNLWSKLSGWGSSLFGIRGLLLTAAFVAAVSFGAGWSVSGRLCKAAALQAENKALLHQAQVMKQAILDDAVRANKDQQEMDALGERLQQLQNDFEAANQKAKDAETKISSGECFSKSESDKLRHGLWK